MAMGIVGGVDNYKKQHRQTQSRRCVPLLEIRDDGQLVATARGLRLRQSGNALFVLVVLGFVEGKRKNLK